MPLFMYGWVGEILPGLHFFPCLRLYDMCTVRMREETVHELARPLPLTAVICAAVPHGQPCWPGLYLLWGLDFFEA